MRTKLITFRELVDREYLCAGFRGKQSKLMAHIATGASVGEQAATHAYKGTRVLPEVAKRLVDWARLTHRVEIDGSALTNAPRKPNAKKGAASKWGGASRTYRAVVQRAGAEPEVIHVTVEPTPDNDVDASVVLAAATSAKRAEG